MIIYIYKNTLISTACCLLVSVATLSYEVVPRIPHIHDNIGIFDAVYTRSIR